MAHTDKKGQKATRAPKAANTKPKGPNPLNAAADAANTSNNIQMPQSGMPQMSPEIQRQMQQQQAMQAAQQSKDIRKSVALQIFCAHVGSSHSALHSENIHHTITASFAAADLFIQAADTGK